MKTTWIKLFLYSSQSLLQQAEQIDMSNIYVTSIDKVRQTTIFAYNPTKGSDLLQKCLLVYDYRGTAKINAGPYIPTDLS